jgi:quercetin dioxygenase-like cupin family protein
MWAKGKVFCIKGAQSIAVIDPAKKRGEDGQYTKYMSSETDIATIIELARAKGCEIRWYYTELATGQGEAIPLKIIITEIPAGHVQPFHTHENIHEVSVVLKGQITVIDSEDLVEEDQADIKGNGTILNREDVVIESPGFRHTVANFSDQPATFITHQTIRTDAEFVPDWK